VRSCAEGASAPTTSMFSSIRASTTRAAAAISLDHDPAAGGDERYAGPGCRRQTRREAGVAGGLPLLESWNHYGGPRSAGSLPAGADRRHGPRAIRRLMQALDSCNSRWGRGAVVSAAAGLPQQRSWSTKFEMQSPAGPPVSMSCLSWAPRGRSDQRESTPAVLMRVG
jgi:hypothetical protein